MSKTAGDCLFSCLVVKCRKRNDLEVSFMEFDFTTVNTGGGVHPFVAERGITDPSIISFSVAEMRLNLAPGITKGMHEIVDKGCFGYAPPEKQRYNAALEHWMETRHHWKIDGAKAIQVGGVVTAMGIALRVLTEPGDEVLIQTPLYPPFARTIISNGRKVVENPLKLVDGRYTMDFDDLREKAKTAKMLMLCSPHNPVGRVWTREELETLGKICLENDLYVVSDEIHFDLDFTGKHLVLTQAVPELRNRSVICTAPSKTFNLAGNALSNIFIEDDEIREKFMADQSVHCGHYLGTFAYASTTAAYETGGPWLDALLVHLQKNRQVLETRLKKMLPDAGLTPLEGTYLQWVDLSCLGLEQPALMEKLESAKIFVNNGEEFGAAGKGHIRFNLACPTACIEEAMDRLEAVL